MNKGMEAVLVIGAIIIIIMLFDNNKLQSVVGIDCPEVKSNSALYGGYYNTNVWVAVDCDGNGQYEAYGYQSSGQTSLVRETKKTPEGYALYCSEPSPGNKQVRIYDTSKTCTYNCYAIYVINYNAASNADLSCNSCTSNWQCTSWSNCVAGLQTRSCVDQNLCGTTTGKPSESQSCTVSCTPNWQCTSWSNCVAGLQTRTCSDGNLCGTTTGKPSESQSCTSLGGWQCDSNSDGTLSWNEFIASAQKWLLS